MTNTPPQPALPPNSAEPLIQLCDLERRYQTKAGFTYVLRQINLALNEGEFITITATRGGRPGDHRQTETAAGR